MRTNEIERDRIVAVLRSTRLMLYAWKAARQSFGLPDNHRELTDTITEIEALRREIEGVDSSQHR